MRTTTMQCPVDIRRADISALTAQSLVAHEHAMIVHLSFTYYANGDVRGRIGVVRSRLLPVLA